MANLGLGCQGQARRFLEELRLSLLARGIIRPGVLAYAGGTILVGGPRADWVRKGVILGGDAAGLTHPVSGAGIPQAVLSGGEAAALAGGQAAAGEDYAQSLHCAMAVIWRGVWLPACVWPRTGTGPTSAF
ncbi:hypothetical protein DFAR_1990006 [Desulfarculales bacterium]